MNVSNPELQALMATRGISLRTLHPDAYSIDPFHQPDGEGLFMLVGEEGTTYTIVNRGPEFSEIYNLHTQEVISVRSSELIQLDRDEVVTPGCYWC